MLPSVSWQDAFTDSNSTGLASHTPDTGSGGYTVQSGAMQVQSNKLQGTSFGSGTFSGSAQARFDVGSAASALNLDFALQGYQSTDDVLFVVLRYDTSANSGFIAYVNTYSFTLYQMTSGSFSIVDQTSISLSRGTTYSLNVENTSSSVSASIGSNSVSYSSSTGNNQTKIVLGIRSDMGSNNGSWIDNLEVSVNHAPVGADTNAVVNENDSVAIQVSDLFTDADGDTLTPSVESEASYGDVSISNGVVIYTPYLDYNGEDSFTISASDGHGGSDTATVNVTVQPLVYLDRAEYFADQNDTATITVSLTGLSAVDVTVHYATSDNTACSGEDYSAASGTVTIEAGKTSKTFTVSTLADSDASDGEAFVVSLSDPTNAGLGAQTKANVVILVALNNVDDLNTIYGQVDTRLTTVNNIRTQGATSVNTVLGNMAQNRADLISADALNFAIRLNAYLDKLSQLEGRVNAMLVTAAEIRTKLADAAADTEGEQFRVAGIRVQFYNLDAQLRGTADQIESERVNLLALLSRNPPLAATPSQRNAISSAATADRGTLAIMRDQLRDFVPNNINSIISRVPAPPGQGIIVTLNTDYNNLLLDYASALVLDAAIHANDAAMSLLQPYLDLTDWTESVWTAYVGLTGNTKNLAVMQAELIGNNDGEVLDPDSAFGLALAASEKPAIAGDVQTGAPPDHYALLGVHSFAGDFDALLTQEIAIIQQQMVWVEDLGAWRDYGPAEDAHINLDGDPVVRGAIWYLGIAHSFDPFAQ